MLSPVFPLRMVIFQIIFLLTAIVLEAMMLRWNLRWSHRVSIERAASINLAAVCMGWLSFFALESWLPVSVREQLVSYIFFNQLFRHGQVRSLPLWLIVGGVSIFFLTFLIKSQSLEFLLRWVDPPAPTPATESAPATTERETTARPRRPARDRQEAMAIANERVIQARTRASAVLQANALSSSVILVLLILRVVLEKLPR